MKWVMTARELADALACAEGPSREIDDRIWRWVNERKTAGIGGKTAAGWEYDLREALAYTESLDAARSLLPIVGTDPSAPDYRADYVLEHTNGGLTIGARVAHNDPNRTAWAENDAMALARAVFEFHVAEGLGDV